MPTPPPAVPRRSWTLAVACTLAACQATGPTAGGPAGASGKAPRPGASAAASATASAGPGAAGQPAAAPAFAVLRRPAAGTATLTGVVFVDAAYAVARGGGILSNNGGSLISDAGGGVVANNGGRVVGLDGATLISDKSGGLVSKIRTGVVSDAGGAVIGQNGAGLVVAAAGGNVVVPGGATGAAEGGVLGLAGGFILSNNGGSLVSELRYGLAQAAGAPAYGETQPAMGMWLSVVDLRTGLTVPLGLDARDQPVHTVYTDAAGAFAVHVPADVLGHARVVARAPGGRDERLALSLIAKGGADIGRIDDDTAATTAYVRYVLGARLLALFEDDLDAALAKIARRGARGGSTAADALSAIAGPAIGKLQGTLQAIGGDRLAPEARRELMMLLADRVLDFVDFDAIVLDAPPADYKPVDPAGAAGLVGRNALGELTAVLRDVRAAAVAKGRDGDPAAYFASTPYMQAANLGRAPEARWVIAKPGDLVDFCVREYLAAYDYAQYEKIYDVLADVGLPLVDRDRLHLAGEAFSLGALQTLFTASTAGGKPVTDVLDDLLRETGARFTAGPPSSPAPAAPPSQPPFVPPVPTPPPAPAALGAVEDVAGAPGPFGQGDGPGASARFGTVFGLARQPGVEPPVFFATDLGGHTIRRIALDAAGQASVTTVAGQHNAAGWADGPGAGARFNLPQTLRFGPDGRLYVSELGNHAIRRIALDAAGQATVETVAGGTAGQAPQPGFADGPGAAARFARPTGLAFDPAGDLFVADNENHRIRRIALGEPGFPVSTFLGDGTPGRVEGPRAAARVPRPNALAFGPDGALWFAEEYSGAIRVLTPGPAGRTRLVAGAGGRDDGPDGFFTNAFLLAPADLAFDAAGRLLVADMGTHRLRAVTPDGWVSTIAGGGPFAPAAGSYAAGDALTARFNGPTAVVPMPDGTLYVADSRGPLVRRLRPR